MNCAHNVPGPCDDVAAIELALVAQWSNFGRAPGGSWHDDGNLVWSEAPVPQLPYNAVVRTQLGSDADEHIDRLCRHFQQRAVHFLWFVHPSAEPSNLAERLAARKLALVERATGMALDLTSWRSARSVSPGPIDYREVTDEHGLNAFEELMATYWELSGQSLPYALGVSRWEFSKEAPGVRWVAYRNSQPVGKVYLSLSGSNDTAAVFGMYVRPDARGHGVAETLSRLAIDRAVSLGWRRVVLHSSEMAVGVYRRLGFVDRCHLSVYATTQLHGSQPT